MKFINRKFTMGGIQKFILIFIFVSLGIISLFNEILDLPHLIFHEPVTPINRKEIIIELFFIFLVGLITIFIMDKLELSRKQAEKVLRESEKKIRNLMESLPIGISISTTGGSISEVNTALLKTFGYNSKEDFIKTSAEAHYYNPKDIERFVKLHKKGLVKGFEVQLKREDGSVFCGSITSTTKVTEAGTPEFINVFEDITKRKQMEEKIYHLNTVLKAIRNVNQLITKEKNKNKLLQKACDNLVITNGYNSALIATFDKNNNFKTFAETGLGENFIQFEEKLKSSEPAECVKRALHQPEFVIIEDAASDCFGCPLSGKEPGEKAITIRLEYRGKIYGVLSVSLPVKFITDTEEQSLFIELADDIAFALYSIDLEEQQKQAKKLLHDSKEKYRLLADNTIDCIWKMNKDMKFTYVNPAVLPMFGFTPEEWTGSLLAGHCSENELQKVMNIIAEEMRKDEDYDATFEIILIHKNGRNIPVEIKGKILIDENKNIVELQGITRDITERKKVSKELEKRLKELEVYYQATLGREGRIIELKQEINTLLERLGEKRKFGV